MQEERPLHRLFRNQPHPRRLVAGCLPRRVSQFARSSVAHDLAQALDDADIRDDGDIDFLEAERRVRRAVAQVARGGQVQATPDAEASACCR